MKGRDLLTEPPVKWESRGAALLLNPRLPDARRDAVLQAEFPDLEDHVWLATSGTGGRTKLVALSRQALESSAQAVNAHLGATPRDIWLNPLPLFHVGGLGIRVRAALTGSRCEELGGWSPEAYVEATKSCRATLSSLVPTQVHDLIRGGWRAPETLRAVFVGGDALSEALRAEAVAMGWPLLPSYGLTEAASQVATAAPGEEVTNWWPLLRHLEARVDEGGILQLRGPSLLTGWMIFGEDGRVHFEDPKCDGWFKTTDRVELRDGKLKMIGRCDDLIKIRGELVDIANLERELQARVPSGLVRLDSAPDARNGALLSVVAENNSALREARGAVDCFPPFARPEVFRVGDVGLGPLGKKIRPKP
jgi:O-succinylbenzoic acid--CoA ligase